MAEDVSIMLTLMLHFNQRMWYMNSSKSISLFIRRCFLFSMIFVSSSAMSSTVMKQFVVTLDGASGERVAASQVMASEGNNKDSVEVLHGVSLLEEFRSADVWFQSFSAEGIANVQAYFSELNIEPTNVIESSFIHTPESVGGPKAGSVRDGHKIYMIGREIPGAGDLPQEKRDEIALGSQGTIDKIGQGIEWDHSYVTSEGTFCVYRANDPSLIDQHAKMMGVPANPITEVEHLVRDYDFSNASM